VPSPPSSIISTFSPPFSKPQHFYSAALSLIKMAPKGSGLQTVVSAVVDIAAAARRPQSSPMFSTAAARRHRPTAMAVHLPIPAATMMRTTMRTTKRMMTRMSVM